MPLLHVFLLVGLGACIYPLPSLAVEVSSTKIASHEINQVAHNANADLVVIAYNSNEKRTGSLIKSSMYASVNEERKTKINIKLTTVGDGQALWKKDSDGVIRGWIFRLRLTIKEVMNEYKRRNEQDFIVLLADALDVYATKSSHADTLESMLHRFVTDFSDHKIVFASQIYCCNPWDLRSVARRDWDDFFASQEDEGYAPPSMYKHLNAGLIIGYASAILEMADEMQLWYVSQKKDLLDSTMRALLTTLLSVLTSRAMQE